MSDDRLRKLCGDRLRKLREDKHLKTDEVADMLGISRSGYAYYEIGKRTPTIENIVKLANFYRVSTDYILGASDMGDNEVSKKTINNIDAKAEELLQNFIQMPDSFKVGVMQWLKSTLDTLDIEPVQLTESQEKLVEKYEHLDENQSIVQTKVSTQKYEVKLGASDGRPAETISVETVEKILNAPDVDDDEL